MITSTLYQMPSCAPTRPSLDATSTSRPPSSAAPATTPPTKSFTKMLKTSVQGTLRAAGLTGTTTSTTSHSRPRESSASNNEDQRTLRPAAATAAAAAAATATATGGNKKRDESRTARGLRRLEGGMNFVRNRRITLTLRTSQPQTAATPQQPPYASTSSITIMHNDTDTDANANADAATMIGLNPFVSPSLHNASMSSPDLLISTSRPAAIRTRPNQQHQHQHQHQQHQQQKPLPRQHQRRESQPQSISRPRPLIPASVSSTSLVHGPDTPTRRNKQPQSPTRKTTHSHSPPPLSPLHSMMRIPSASASTSHLPHSSPYGIYPTHHRNASSTSLLSSPYRESIRKASSLLVRELLRPPQGVKPRDWEHIEFRLRSLVRLERIWGKSGATASSTALATSSTIGMGGSEDRERRIFCESVRDGYVLCM